MRTHSCAASNNIQSQQTGPGNNQTSKTQQTMQTHPTKLFSFATEDKDFIEEFNWIVYRNCTLEIEAFGKPVGTPIDTIFFNLNNYQFEMVFDPLKYRRPFRAKLYVQIL